MIIIRFIYAGTCTGSDVPETAGNRTPKIGPPNCATVKTGELIDVDAPRSMGELDLEI